MSKPGKTGISRIIDASIYSKKGFIAAWKNEAAFRQEACLLVVMSPIAFWLGESAAEQAILLASCLLVVIVELLNSAIEAVVDRIGPEHHELSGRAKDMGSAAVFVSLMVVIICWSLIAWQRFL
jgi:diacylglycerol kinase (ATP)